MWKRPAYWPAHRTLFLPKSSAFGSAFWAAVVLVAVGAAVVMVLWMPPTA